MLLVCQSLENPYSIYVLVRVLHFLILNGLLDILTDLRDLQNIHGKCILFKQTMHEFQGFYMIINF